MGSFPSTPYHINIPQRRFLITTYIIFFILVFMLWFYLLLARSQNFLNYPILFAGVGIGYWISKYIIDAVNQGWKRFTKHGTRALWQYKSGRKALLGIIFLQAIPFSIWFAIVLSVFNNLGENIGDTEIWYLKYYQHYALGAGLAWLYINYKWIKRVGKEKGGAIAVNSKLLIPLLIIFIFCIGIKCFAIDMAIILSESMEPNLMKGDRVVVVKSGYKIKRGDIIFFNLPEKSINKLVKRVAGLPGEKLDIKGGNVYINKHLANCPEVMQRIYYFRPKNFGVQQIPEKDIYVLGDNSFGSLDSRMWGSIPLRNVVGKVVLIYWPPKRGGWVK